jgi:hypothetical protein
MAQDFMHYDQMVQAAYRGIVRDALARAAKEGLRGAHHFYLVFRTHYPGVEISDALRSRYPLEMTIVLQHEYWNLTVQDDYFEVGLSFNKIAETLHIPFTAIRQFFDPSVKFGLEFQLDGPGGETEKAPTPSPPKAPESAQPASPPETGAVVSLDAFRKK